MFRCVGGFSLLVVAACAESRSPIPSAAKTTTSKPRDAVALAIKETTLTAIPLVGAQRLEFRTARLDGSDATTLQTVEGFAPLHPIRIEIPTFTEDRIFSAALVFADGHRLVSSLHLPGANQNPPSLPDARRNTSHRSYLGEPVSIKPDR